MEGYGNENPGAFQSTRPLRGATSCLSTCWKTHQTFQPTRPLRGATLATEGRTIAVDPFQPTRPLRGATLASFRTPPWELFQPTRPLRGATGEETLGRTQQNISTHAPLAGRDPRATPTHPAPSRFQPTRPLRGATSPTRESATLGRFQSTRPLRGATIIRWRRGDKVMISTHAPLAGRDREFWMQEVD